MSNFRNSLLKSINTFDLNQVPDYIMWFDGKGNQADGSFATSPAYWFPKSPNEAVASSRLEVVNTTFDNDGGLLINPSSSTSVLGARDIVYGNNNSPDSRVNGAFMNMNAKLNKSSGFTIETVVDLENKSSNIGSEYYMFGVTYLYGSSGYMRGGFNIINGYYCYQYNNGSWQKPSFGVSKQNGKQILTIVLGQDNKLRLYINGISIGSSISVASDFEIPTNEDSPMALGGYDANAGTSMYGKFYSMKMYLRPLSDDEIKTNFEFANKYYNLGIV